MNDIESRLSADLKEFAQGEQPDVIRPLRMPAPRRRARTARWLAPVAAATAVVAVVVGVIVAGRSVANRPATGAPAGMPAYYVTLMYSERFTHGQGTPTQTETARVYDSATGHLLDEVWVPPGTGTSAAGTISAAADDRLFAISSNGDSSIYLLRLAADGRSEGLRKLPVKDGIAGGIVPELSPDGSHLAYVVQNCPGGCISGIGVVPVARPAAAKIWRWNQAPPVQLSWAGDGNQVMIGTETNGQAQILRYRLLNVTGPAGNLLSESRPIKFPSAMSEAPVLLTSGGRTAVGSTQQIDRSRHTVTGKVVELSRSTGRLRVLYVGTEHYTSKQGVPAGREADTCTVQSLAATGVQPLILCYQRFGRIVDGKFTPLPGEPGPISDYTFWDAAW